MKVTSEPRGDDAVVFRAEGRLNMVSSPALREATSRALRDGRTRIVVDLSGVDFMDSSGLGTLISCLKSARQADGDLLIATPSAQVALVLSLSNVDRILIPHESVDAAYHA